ncbi:MAG TPA: hypothetical protein IGS40_27715 [Trichormus sp. M33_DOE_039]|nr:hypothetical protein [Trichormus sp. M33_DOE_039]
MYRESDTRLPWKTELLQPKIILHSILTLACRVADYVDTALITTGKKTLALVTEMEISCLVI